MITKIRLSDGRWFNLSEPLSFSNDLRPATNNRNASELLPLFCRDMSSEIGNGAGEVMFAPEGDSTICPSIGGIATAIVTIRVDKSTAAVLDASLQKINAENSPQRAFFDFNHKQEEALSWPLAFQWKSGPRAGVVALVEYSSLGKSYVDGKVVRSFSGSFFTDADLPKRSQVKAGQVYEVAEGKRGSQENPARIISLNFPAAGGYTNSPAFERNQPLWSHQKRS